MLITRKSPFTGNVNTRDIPATESQMAEFALPNRRNIQDIFPNLSADDREFIKTGITPEEWAATFGDDE